MKVSICIAVLVTCWSKWIQIRLVIEVDAIFMEPDYMVKLQMLRRLLFGLKICSEQLCLIGMFLLQKITAVKTIDVSKYRKRNDAPVKNGYLKKILAIYHCSFDQVSLLLILVENNNLASLLLYSGKSEIDVVCKMPQGTSQIQFIVTFLFDLLSKSYLAMLSHFIESRVHQWRFRTGFTPSLFCLGSQNFLVSNSGL